MPKGDIVPGSELGERLYSAILAEGRTVNSVEEELRLSRGHLGRIIRGERWKETVDIGLAKSLCAVLHIQLEWLLTSEGPRRREGRPATPAEVAIVFARRNGAREDAIKSAWERNKDREAEMSELDWVLAINGEAIRLTGVARPEAVYENHRRVRRLKGKKTRLLQAKEEEKNAKETDEKRAARLRLAGNHD
jgi:hypothetical protein